MVETIVKVKAKGGVGNEPFVGTGIHRPRLWRESMNETPLLQANISYLEITFLRI